MGVGRVVIGWTGDRRDDQESGSGTDASRKVLPTPRCSRNRRRRYCATSSFRFASVAAFDPVVAEGMVPPSDESVEDNIPERKEEDGGEVVIDDSTGGDRLEEDDEREATAAGSGRRDGGGGGTQGECDASGRGKWPAGGLWDTSCACASLISLPGKIFCGLIPAGNVPPAFARDGASSAARFSAVGERVVGSPCGVRVEERKVPVRTLATGPSCGLPVTVNDPEGFSFSTSVEEERAEAEWVCSSAKGREENNEVGGARTGENGSEEATEEEEVGEEEAMVVTEELECGMIEEEDEQPATPGGQRGANDTPCLEVPLLCIQSPNSGEGVPEKKRPHEPSFRSS